MALILAVGLTAQTTAFATNESSYKRTTVQQTAFATTGNETNKICVINATESCLGKPVGVSTPWQPPTLNVNITGNTTMAATSPNATAATNEHDYRYGFGWGLGDYNSSSTDTGLDFYVTSTNDVAICNNAHTHADPNYAGSEAQVLNATACRDGYLGGWKYWCTTDALHCAYWAAAGSVPSLAVQSNRVNHCAQFFCLDRESLANVYHTPQMSPGSGIVPDNGDKG
jgi:hypothetical protein